MMKVCATMFLQTLHNYETTEMRKPGLRSRIPNNTGGQSRIFCPTPDVQLDHIYITLLNWDFL